MLPSFKRYTDSFMWWFANYICTPEPKHVVLMHRESGKRSYTNPVVLLSFVSQIQCIKPTANRSECKYVEFMVGQILNLNLCGNELFIRLCIRFTRIFWIWWILKPAMIFFNNNFSHNLLFSLLDFGLHEILYFLSISVMYIYFPALAFFFFLVLQMRDKLCWRKLKWEHDKSRTIFHKNNEIILKNIKEYINYACICMYYVTIKNSR